MTLAATIGEEEDIASFGKDAEPLPRDDNGDLKELKINQIVQVQLKQLINLYWYT